MYFSIVRSVGFSSPILRVAVAASPTSSSSRRPPCRNPQSHKIPPSARDSRKTKITQHHHHSDETRESDENIPHLGNFTCPTALRDCDGAHAVQIRTTLTRTHAHTYKKHHVYVVRSSTYTLSYEYAVRCTLHCPCPSIRSTELAPRKRMRVVCIALYVHACMPACVMCVCVCLSAHTARLGSLLAACYVLRERWQRRVSCVCGMRLVGSIEMCNTNDNRYAPRGLSSHQQHRRSAAEPASRVRACRVNPFLHFCS